MVDCQLGFTRLYLAYFDNNEKNDWLDQAQESLGRAQDGIDKTGYHLQKKQAEQLRQEINDRRGQRARGEESTPTREDYTPPSQPSRGPNTVTSPGSTPT
jgi:hypothetical protein